MNAIERAIAHAGGPVALTRKINECIARPISYQAVRKWAAAGRLPRTDYTGETTYASAIERATGGAITEVELLGRLAGAVLP